MFTHFLICQSRLDFYIHFSSYIFHSVTCIKFFKYFISCKNEEEILKKRKLIDYSYYYPFLLWLLYIFLMYYTGIYFHLKRWQIFDYRNRLEHFINYFFFLFLYHNFYFDLSQFAFLVKCLKKMQWEIKSA